MSGKVNFSQIRKCDQIWDEMPQCHNARICGKCSEKIVDFRGLSEWEIALIHSRSNKKICGVYDDHILDPEKPKSANSGVKRKFFLAGIVGILTSTPAFGNHINNELEFEVVENKYSKSLLPIDVTQEKQDITSEVRDSIKIIEGFLKDDSNEPIIGGTLIVKGTNDGTCTDIDGRFELNISEHLQQNDSIFIEVHYVGYGSTELKILKTDFENNNRIKKEIVITAGEMLQGLVFSAIHLKWYQKIGRGFRNMFRKKN